MYVSTRGGVGPVDFAETVVTGLAPDGGLFVPESIPSLPIGWRHWSYPEAIAGSLELFGAEDVDGLAEDAAARFAHPEVAPIVEVGDRLVLELFHGPTLSFKDHALQVVARLLDRYVQHGTILGATSGDTGSAAIEACRGSKQLDIVILFPEGKVSEFQRRQMTTVRDENVTTVAVRGTFDDCQALVKRAMADRPGLLAINSINWARIAAQVGYYVHAGTRIGEPFDVVIPTGNFGNAYSCWLAKQMGVLIETITIANNANHALADLIDTGVMSPSEVVATTAPAMDIQVPSNLERFGKDPTAEFLAGWSNDAEIRETIATVFGVHGYVLDPHTATSWRAGADNPGDRPNLVVSTAHPAKFGDVVFGAVGRRPELPPGFDRLMDLPERVVTIDASPSELDMLIR
ncbi:MAG: threonine synthase [Actinobacteria bacterium]|nr:threonine synthase [Actinomycetota bacterium]